MVRQIIKSSESLQFLIISFIQKKLSVILTGGDIVLLRPLRHFKP